MSNKFIFFIILSASFAFSQTSREFELNANKVEFEEDILKASGGVSLASEEYLLSADSAEYDKNSSDISLKNNIEILRGDTLLLKSEHFEGNLQNQSYALTPFYMLDKESDLWINSEQGCINKEQFDFNKTLISSCDENDPIWYFTFKEGSYDDNTSWVKMYHPTLYVKNVPVFYSPFLMFMASSKRRSGLLFPTIGYSSNDGATYKQPLYIAPQDNWDLTLTPQIKTNRGAGGSAELRFVDDEDSSGTFKFGFFEDTSEYRNKFNLRNKIHHGAELDYINHSLISSYFSEIFSDGLYIDSSILNDSSYINLLSEDDNFDIKDKIVTSKLNYYLQSGSHYLGVYGKYFYDTSLVTNRSTLQELPTLHYHKYKEPIFYEGLLYSIDTKMTNYTRIQGLEAKKYEATLPFGIYFPLLNDYLTLGLFQELYFMKIHYGNEADFGRSVEDGDFAMNSFEVSLQSDLIKEYENFLHSIQMGVSHKEYSYKQKNGYFADFIELPSDRETTNLRLNNFLFDKNGELFLSNRTRQAFYFDDYDYKYGDMLNEMKYQISDTYNIEQTTKYSHQFGRATGFITSLNYEEKDNYKIGVSHYFRDDNVLQNANYFGLDVEKKYSSFDIFGDVRYDFSDGVFRSWRFGFTEDVGCYEYGVSYIRDYVPMLRLEGSRPMMEDYIYFTLVLKPIGGTNYKFHRYKDGVSR